MGYIFQDAEYFEVWDAGHRSGHCYIRARIDEQRNINIQRWPELAAIEEVVKFGQWAAQFAGSEYATPKA